MTRPPIALFIAASLLLASPVHAQRSPEDRAAADALYEESGALMKANRFAEACPKLETSQRLDPGIGTLIRLGYCYEQLGRTASAWSAYNEAEGRARKAGDKRADDAAARGKALEPKLSRLLLATQSPIPGLEIRRDGKPVDPGLWGSAVPVDPGEHVIEASAPGRQRWATNVQVAAGGASVAVAVPELPRAKAPDTPAKGTAWGAQRIAGVTIGGAGVVGLVVSAIFTARMVSKNNESKAHCLPTDPDVCFAEGVLLRSQALDAARVATPTFIAGAVTATTGLVVFLTAPHGAKASKTPVSGWSAQPVIGPGMAGLHVRGMW